MTIPTQITDHVDRAQQDLKSQFYDSPKLNELVKFFATEIQDLEDVWYEILTERGLWDWVVGAQLDQMGRLVGLDRQDLTDDDLYRLALRVKVIVNQSHSLAKTLINTVSTMVDEPAQYRWQGTRNFSIEWESETELSDLWITWVNRFIREQLGLGMSYEATEGVETAFRLDTAGAGLDEGQLARRIDVLGE